MKKFLYILLGLGVVFLGWEYFFVSPRLSNMSDKSCGGDLHYNSCPLGSYCKSSKSSKRDSSETNIYGGVNIDFSGIGGRCSPIIKLRKITQIGPI